MDIYVDKEKRTIVAVMTNVQSDIYNYLRSCLCNRDVNSYEYIYAPGILRDMIYKSVPNILRAKAKCSPEDNFSEDVGEDLARARLLEKYHSHCLSILFKYEEYVYKHLNNKLTAAINMMGDKLYADNGTLVDILSSTGALD
jgi:hypothetical protein